MPSPSDSEQSRFTKSKRNQVTQKAGLSIILRDRRFRLVDKSAREAMIALVRTTKPHGRFGAQSFDLVMAPPELPPVTAENVAEHFHRLRLVEMKATRKAIRDASLSRFFFGLTEREADLAEALGPQFLFAFVVLSSDNVFGRPFARLLTLTELRERTRPWRTQFQVNFRPDLEEVSVVADSEMILLLDEQKD